MTDCRISNNAPGQNNAIEPEDANSARPRAKSNWALVSAILVTLTACAGPPRGDSGGRLDPGETTAADVFSDQANVPDLFAFGDQVGEALAYQISDIPEIRNNPNRVILELGSLQNETRTPLSDFEMIQKRLHRAVQRSPHLRNKVMVVASRDRMDYEMSKLGAGGGAATYDPNQTYVLQGDFYEAIRGNARRYWFNLQLTNVASRAIVFTEDFEPGYLKPVP